MTLDALVALLSDPTSAGLLVGLLAPPLTAVVQQPKWSPAVRRGVAVVVALVLGGLTSVAQGLIDPGSEDVFGTALTVLVASQATYGTLWRRAVPAIENATSRTPPVAPTPGVEERVLPADVADGLVTPDQYRERLRRDDLDTPGATRIP